MKTLFTIFLTTLTGLVWGASRITVDNGGRFASILMTESEYAGWISSSPNFDKNDKRTALVKEVYQLFKDDFDFIFMIANETNIPAGFPYYGELISVSNNVTGIGSGIFNYGTNYGSDGKLKSTIFLPARKFILYGPTLHELSHQWGNFLFNAGITWDGVNFYNSSIPHWGFTGAKGQLGGFDPTTLISNVDGNPNKYKVGSFGLNANGGNGLPYSDIELYLMGMAPASEVADFTVYTDVTFYDYNTQTFIANKKTTYKASNYPRTPDYSSSQKEFKILFLLLTKSAVTSAEASELNRHIDSFCLAGSDGSSSLYNFWEATKGRGKIYAENLDTSIKTSDSNTILNNNFKAFVTNGKIKIEGLGNNATITLIDICGRILMQKNTNLVETELSTKNINRGVYIIKADGSNGCSSQKIIIP